MCCSFFGFASGFLTVVGLAHRCTQTMSSYSISTTLDVEHGPYEPLPYVLAVFLGVYVVGLVLWVLNWLRYDDLHVPLQRHLTILPCVKVLCVAAGWAFWWHCAPQGFELTCNGWLLALYKASDVLFRCGGC